MRALRIRFWVVPLPPNIGGWLETSSYCCPKWHPLVTCFFATRRWQDCLFGAVLRS